MLRKQHRPFCSAVRCPEITAQPGLTGSNLSFVVSSCICILSFIFVEMKIYIKDEEFLKRENDNRLIKSCLVLHRTLI